MATVQESKAQGSAKASSELTNYCEKAWAAAEASTQIPWGDVAGGDTIVSAIPDLDNLRSLDLIIHHGFSFVSLTKLPIVST